jgi:hypothetical protein
MGKNFKTVQYPLLAATARPCPTTCSPQATGFVRSVPVRQILHASVIRPQCGKPRENEHRAPTRPTMAAMLRRLTAGFARRTSAFGRRSLGAIRSQLWCLHRVRTLRSFSAGGRCSPARPPRRQGPAASGTHFSRRSLRTTLDLAQNWRKSLTC